MTNTTKIYTAFIGLLLSIYFIIVVLTQCYDQGWSFFKVKPIQYLKEHYVSPFFEQNWGMFSPNPPHGNEYIMVKFYTQNDSTKLINIHEKIKENSFKNPFSLNQRIIKYFNECYGDIATKHSEGYLGNEFVKKSYGLQSILNYSKIVLKNQKEFLKGVNPNDTIKVNLYLVQEPLNDFEKSKLKREQFYTEIKHLNLTTKNKLSHE
jgi:Family of unknown function (DUF5819)